MGLRGVGPRPVVVMMTYLVAFIARRPRGDAIPREKRIWKILCDGLDTVTVALLAGNYLESALAEFYEKTGLSAHG